MHFIDGKGHKSELKGNNNYLINYTKYANHTTSYVFIALGVDTHTYVHIRMKIISRNQMCWLAPSLKMFQIQVWPMGKLVIRISDDDPVAILMDISPYTYVYVKKE